MARRQLMVTIDTEVDKDRYWTISDPASFRSVLTGIPTLLSPLFESYGVKPTYLLSPEVIEDPSCAVVLGSLGDRAELGTHLHAEFVNPGRLLTPHNMAGQSADAVQCQYPSDVERTKLCELTELFRSTFGYSPSSFRAGRFALSPATHEALAGLGYLVDSSVTPGLRWTFADTILDYSQWDTEPRWIETPRGSILEIPVGIKPGGRLAPAVSRAPTPLARTGRLLLGRRGRYTWLRPSWEDGRDLVRYVRSCQDRLMVLMFHSTEIIQGASPYADTQDSVTRILESLRLLFEYCLREDIGFCGLSEASAHA